MRLRLASVDQTLVDEFWRRGGHVEDFPRSLDRAIALALPVALVKLPRLRLHAIERWMATRGVDFRFGCVSREVRGCLVAYSGQGIVFLDGADPDDERRFTLAHEIGHFLSDHWHPRRAAIGKFGGSIADVVDGIRSPTVSERLHALLSGTSISVHSDLMERNKPLNDLGDGLWEIEDRADNIALELLAPAQSVLGDLPRTGRMYSQRLSDLTRLLRDKFGLPCAIARAYSGRLLSAAGKEQSWLETMGLR